MDAKLGPVIQQSFGSADAWHTTTNPKGTLIDSTWGATGGTAGTGVTGDVPAGWTIGRLSGASITAAATLRARVDGKGGKELLLEMGGTDAGAIRTYGTAAFLNTPSWVIDDGVYTECDIDFTPVSGLCSSYNFFRTTGGTEVVMIGLYNDGIVGWPKAFSGRLRTPIIVSDSTAITLQGWTVEEAFTATAEFDVVRRNYVAYKYDTTAAGALSW